MVQTVRPSCFLYGDDFPSAESSKGNVWSTVADTSCWPRCQILLGRPGSQRSTNKPRVYLVKALKIWLSLGTRYHISSRQFVLFSFFITWIRNLLVTHRLLFPVVLLAFSCYIGYSWFQHLYQYSYNGNRVVQDGDGKPYEAALRKAMWVPHIYRISVAQTEYMNEKRQRLTVRTVGPVDWAAESRHLLENIAKVR